MIQTGITFHQPGFETDGNSRVSIKPGKEKKDGKFRANLGKSSGSDPDTAGEVRRRPARSDDVRRGQTTTAKSGRAREGREGEYFFSLFLISFLIPTGRKRRSDDTGEVRRHRGGRRGGQTTPGRSDDPRLYISFIHAFIIRLSISFIHSYIFRLSTLIYFVYPLVYISFIHAYIFRLSTRMYFVYPLLYISFIHAYIFRLSTPLYFVYLFRLSTRIYFVYPRLCISFIHSFIFRLSTLIYFVYPLVYISFIHAFIFRLSTPLYFVYPLLYI
jgi:hypothetical protein